MKPSTQIFLFNPAFTRIIVFLLLLLIIVFGWLLRLEDLGDWQNHSETAFYKGEPLLRGLDGYFYLTLARDQLEGNYAKMRQSERTGLQHTLPRAEIIPAASAIVAFIASYTELSERWAAVLLAPILGPLLAIPLFFIGRILGGTSMGLTAALLGISAPGFVERSELGWFDTDSLNVLFMLMLSYLFMGFVGAKPDRGRGYIVAAVFVYGGFIWWWDQAYAQITAIFVFLLAMTWILCQRPRHGERLLFFALMVVACAMLFFLKGETIMRAPLNQFIEPIKLVVKNAPSEFPNVGITITELLAPPYQKIIINTAGGVIPFVAGVIGLILLFLRRPREIALLMPCLVLGLWGGFAAQRFMIFLGPMLALGSGFLVSCIWRKWGARCGLYLLIGLSALVLMFAISANLRNYQTTYLPTSLPVELAEGLERIQLTTPENAIIWSWWDFGHPIRYWSRRQPINDGHIEDGGERMTYSALPLATNNQRLAANFMRFYATHGQAGMAVVYRAVGGDKSRGFALIKQIMAAGPQHTDSILTQAQLSQPPPSFPSGSFASWQSFFFPNNALPVYLLLPAHLRKLSYWWFWFGSWSEQHHQGHHPIRVEFINLIEKDGSFTNADLQVNITTGVVQHQDEHLQLDHLAVHDGSRFKHYPYSHGSGLTMLILKPLDAGILMDKQLAQSVFSQLYFFNDTTAKYFRPVLVHGLIYQLWEVLPDIASDTK